MRIFVYGTLRSGEGANHLLQGCRLAGPASVSGTLFDVDGRFPALTLEGRTTVQGEVWTGPDGALEALDLYEGVADGLFRRAEIVVDGEACWIYVAGPRLEPHLSAATRVPGGEWRRRSDGTYSAWREARG